jgi:hypothetical protein
MWTTRRGFVGGGVSNEPEEDGRCHCGGYLLNVLFLYDVLGQFQV